MITHPLPTEECPNTMAPVARQVASLRNAGLEVDVLEVRGISKLKYLHALRQFHKLLPRTDLVHAHFGYCGWLARTQLRKPVVLSFMGDDLLGTPDAHGRIKPLSQAVVQINRRTARYVDAVIVKSNEMARVVAPTHAYVVPNGVDLSLFRPMPMSTARSELEWPMAGYRVLFPGDPANPRKGFRLAQEATALAAAAIGAEIELVPLCNVQPGQVSLYMNACNAMLMTSFVEGSPNVVKEALACNLPIAAVPVGDVGELLNGVQNSAVCPYRAETLASALSTMLHDQLRSNGREMLKRRGLDLQSVANRIVGIYDCVLDGAPMPTNNPISQ